MKMNFDSVELAARIFVALAALEWPRDDAKNPRETADRAFDLADAFVDELFARHQESELLDAMGEPPVVPGV